MRKVFRGQRVVVDGSIAAKTVWVENGIIEKILDYDADVANADEVIDIDDAVLMPGIVDSHVHINEPGRTEWEGFDTATHAAAAGGITTVVDMPLNCIPVTISKAAFDEKLAVIGDKLWIDTAFWGGATSDNLDKLPELLAAGVHGVKSFTIHSGIDEFKHVNRDQLRDAMRELAKRGLPHLVHAELDEQETPPQEIATSYQSFLKTRPTVWENDAIAMVISVMEELASEGLTPHAHIVHLSSAEALPMIREARAKGLKLTVETCPHYLVLEAETIPDGQASFKCCPPIREKANQEELWQALLDGDIDCVVSDHSPCTPQLKNLDSGDIEKAWGGISGLQFGLPLIWTHAKQKNIALEKISELMSARSAEVAGIEQKGKIAPGYQADFCVFDPDDSFEVRPEIIHHRHKVSPYNGKTLNGVVKQTWLAANLIYSDGEFHGSAIGRPLFKVAEVTDTDEATGE